LLVAARQKSIPLSPLVIQEAGTNFVQAGKSDSGAWDVAMRFLDYKSFLNSVDVNSPLPPGTRVDETHYTFPKKNYRTLPRMVQFGASRAPNIPVIRELNAPSLNQNVGIGPSFLVLIGGDLVLDGLYLKQIIIRDAHVIYKGGSLTMENVYFINCTFDIQQEPQGQAFALAVLSEKLDVHLKVS
jgi:hypothetical protein